MSKESVLQSLEVAETLEDLEKAVHVTLRKPVAEGTTGSAKTRFWCGVSGWSDARGYRGCRTFHRELPAAYGCMSGQQG